MQGLRDFFQHVLPKAGTSAATLGQQTREAVEDVSAPNKMELERKGTFCRSQNQTVRNKVYI